MKKYILVACSLLVSLNIQAQLTPPPKNSVIPNQKGGFYTNAFTLTIASTTPGDTIVYTLDCSDPRYSSAKIIKQAPFTVTIDPASTTGRSATPAVILRASKKSNGLYSYPILESYIFPDKVKVQGNPTGNGWASTFGVNNQVIDYKMDTKVTTNATYKDSIDDALLDISTLSVVTPTTSLFASDTGIYVNASNDGIEWEREAAVQLINPNNSPGFQIGAGLRIRGGYSRNGDNPKHSFRLFFRNQYGDSKLKFPLFEKEGEDEFDKIDLRTAQNYSWSFANSPRMTMSRDAFSRDLQGAMGQPYTRGRFYHLYLDGMYWGIYQTDERPSASFCESYLGGKKDDYDVVKINVPSYTIEATDGTMDSWNAVWNLCKQGFTLNANYFKLRGLDANGNRDQNLPIMVDIDNLIDYMILIFYTGNVDAPVSEFLGNMSPNNFYAVYNRKKKDGFRFIAHDSEHTLLVEPGDIGDGINENRVNIGTTGEMQVTDLSKFQPQWLHYRLTANSNYRARFIDRVYRHFFNEGAMTVANLQKMFMERSLQIETAIIAESARWGDAKKRTTAYTKADWMKEVNNINKNFFPQRGTIVLDQLTDEGLYSAVAPPTYSNNSVTINTWVFKTSAGTIVKITNPGNGGTIYYSTDGTDPRGTNGGINGNAKTIVNNGTITLTASGQLRSRVYNNGNWSPMHEVYVFIPEEMKKIKLTEIHYHPESLDTTVSSKDLEFIEIKNTSQAPINLTGLSVTEGIGFTFPRGTVLQQGQYLVLASNDSVFEAHNGFKPFGDFSGNLNDKTESIVIKHQGGDTIAFVSYLDSLPWPNGADGGGRTLEILNEAANPNSGLNWFDGCIGGSPGKAYEPCNDPIVFSEINFYSSFNADADDWVELYNTTPNDINISKWIFRDSKDNEFYEIPSGTTLKANDRVVLAKDPVKFKGVHTGVTKVLGPYTFSLSNTGELLRLYNDKNELQFSVNYVAGAPWPTEANGKGKTLELKDPAGQMNSASNWFAGCMGGSPAKEYNVNCVTNAVENLKNKNFDMIVYSNTPQDLMEVNIIAESNDLSQITFSIYDVLGKQIEHINGLKENKIVIAKGSLNAGIYFLNITKDAETVTKKIVIN